MSLEFREPAASKNAGITYHLAVQSEWDTHKDGATYVPGAYEADGFIHCTNGLDLLTDVANMFYKDSVDQRTILVLDVNRIDSDLIYDDVNEHFPHIYGPLNTSAVVGELTVERGDDGTFTHLGSIS